MQRFQPESAIGEIPRQPVQQFGIVRRIAHTQVVERFDQAGPEVLMPDTIDSRAREVRILRGSYPTRQCDAAIFGAFYDESLDLL